MAKKIKWHKIAPDEETLQLEEKDIKISEFDGRQICITRHNNQLYGFAYKCPHAGAFMSRGYIDMQGNAVCPLHRYKFSLQNGRNTSGEGYYMKTYPIEIRQDGVYAGVEESSFLF